MRSAILAILWVPFVVFSAPARGGEVDLSGTVLDAVTKAPLPDVPVRITSALNVKTDAEGSFAVRFSTGFETLDLVANAGHADGRYCEGKRTVSAASQAVRFELLPRFGTFSGVVTDAVSGQPLAGIEVVLGFEGSAQSPVKTDGAGRYLIQAAAFRDHDPDKPEDRYVLRANSGSADADYLPRARGSLRPAPFADTSRPTGVDFALTPRHGHAVVTVVDAGDGRPLPGVHVTFGIPGSVKGDGKTDAGGRVVLKLPAFADESDLAKGPKAWWVVANTDRESGAYLKGKVGEFTVLPDAGTDRATRILCRLPREGAGQGAETTVTGPGTEAKPGQGTICCEECAAEIGRLRREIEVLRTLVDALTERIRRLEAGE